MKTNLIEYLSQFITENKKQLIGKILQDRTRYLTVAIEDIYQPHNASAVVRTCDCFGIQDLHIIENRNKYTVNPDVTLGSSKWVNIIKYDTKEDNNTVRCIENLKSQDYKVFATTPHHNDIEIESLPIDTKIALIFGNEKEGLSQEAIEAADGYVKIPMYGFTESLNISVSAAICIHEIVHKLRNSKINWKLSEEEMQEIQLEWIRGIIKNADLLEQEFYNKNT
jgi:tRNA (guanosine-2'-O-)-methyltransferase